MESQEKTPENASTSKRKGAQVDESGKAPAKKSRLSFAFKLGVGIVIMIIVVFVSFMIGRYQNVDAIQAIKITLHQIFPMLPIEQDWAELDASVVLSIRWPRIIIALFVGAALSCSGAAYQGVFRNPLVSPDILGISAAAGFGAAVAIVFFDPLLSHGTNPGIHMRHRGRGSCLLACPREGADSQCDAHLGRCRRVRGVQRGHLDDEVFG